MVIKLIQHRLNSNSIYLFNALFITFGGVFIIICECI